MIPAERERLEADLSAWLDGELSAERAAEVEALLERSSSARRALDELRAVATRVQALPRMPAPADLETRILREAAADATRRAHDVEFRIRAARRFEFLRGGLVATAALFGVYSINAFWAGRPTTAPVETAGRGVGVGAESARERKVIDGPPEFAKLNVPAPEGDSAGEAVAGVRIQTGRVALDSPDLSKVADAPELAAVDRRDEESDRMWTLAPAGGEVAAITGYRVSGGNESQTADFAPEINIVIAPRDMEQYDNAVTVSNDVMRYAMEDFNTASRAVLLAGRPVQRQEVFFSVAQPQLGQVLQILESGVPEQVEVQLRFRAEQFQQVRQLIDAPKGATESENQITAAYAGLDERIAEERAAPVATAAEAPRLAGEAHSVEATESPQLDVVAPTAAMPPQPPALARRGMSQPAAPPADDARKRADPESAPSGGRGARAERTGAARAEDEIADGSDAERESPAPASIDAASSAAPQPESEAARLAFKSLEDLMERSPELGAQVNEGVQVVARSLQSGLLRVADALVDQYRPRNAPNALPQRALRMRVTVLEPAAPATAPSTAPVSGGE